MVVFLAFWAMILMISVLCSYVWNRNLDNFNRYGFAYYRSFFAAVVVTVIAAVWYGDSRDGQDYTEVHTETQLIAAADGQSLSGGGFIFFSIGSQSRYFYYTQNEDGGIIQGSVPTARTVLYEDSSPEEARIVEITYEESTGSCWVWCWPVNVPGPRNWIIHVPEGSVIRDFNFDLE